MSDKPTGKTRDDVATWLARTHLEVDSSIREVWYLPEGAPADEIRFLERSDRLAGPEMENEVEALDFGLNVEGSPFLLLVADVTTDQLEQIKNDESRLPTGWALDGNTIWRRRR